MLLSSDEGFFVDNGLLGVLVRSLKEVEDLVFLEKFIDEGNIRCFPLLLESLCFLDLGTRM